MLVPVMRRISLGTAAVIATALAGCAYPNQFRNVRGDFPHAVLIGDGATLTHINGQPTSFWRTRERFKVPPGPTTVRVIAGRSGEFEYPLLHFVAEAGHRYAVERTRTGVKGSILVREGEGTGLRLEPGVPDH